MRETLYGRQAIRESLRAGRRKPFRLLMAETVVDSPIIEEILTLAQRQRVPVMNISRHEMETIVGHANHQGVALETTDYPYVTLDDMLNRAEERGEKTSVLLLDLIQDVHNLGSLIRTAEAVGVHGVVIQSRRAAGVTPAVVDTSSGAVEHMLIAQETNLVQAIEALKSKDIWIAGLEYVYGAKPYTEVDLTMPLGDRRGERG